jgi:hypothetical protein
VNLDRLECQELRRGIGERCTSTNAKGADDEEHTDADSASSDQEILIALKPSLATTGGPMLVTSSPSTMEGIVYIIFTSGITARKVIPALSSSRAIPRD